MVKKFFVNAAAMNKWMHQNGIIDFLDCKDGVLLDSFIAYTKKGLSAVYESPVNCWNSRYYVEFSRNCDDPAIWNNWEAFCSNIEQ